MESTRKEHEMFTEEEMRQLWIFGIAFALVIGIGLGL